MKRANDRPKAQGAQDRGKRPLEIDLVMERIAQAVRPFPKAALFELAEEGFHSPFEQLVACILSIRTRDETTVVLARRLFSSARTPAQLLGLGVEKIEQCIGKSTFARGKAQQLVEIARRVLQEHHGVTPCEREVLLSFSGVGPKCANLVLGIACAQTLISVDIHVHRVTNRWGYVHAATPEATLRQLEKRLAQKYWVEINRFLVPFGKHICTGVAPRCSTCVVLDMCRQIGVGRHR